MSGSASLVRENLFADVLGTELEDVVDLNHADLTTGSNGTGVEIHLHREYFEGYVASSDVDVCRHCSTWVKLEVRDREFGHRPVRDEELIFLIDRLNQGVRLPVGDVGGATDEVHVLRVRVYDDFSGPVPGRSLDLVALDGGGVGFCRRTRRSEHGQYESDHGHSKSHG